MLEYPANPVEKNISPIDPISKTCPSFWELMMDSTSCGAVHVCIYIIYIYIHVYTLMYLLKKKIYI